MKKYIAALGLVICLCGCSGDSAAVKTDDTKLVKITDVAAEAYGDSITLSGSVVPVEQASVSFKLAGVINQVYVSEGERVQKGQKLASLKDSDYRLQAEAAKAQTAGADAQTATASAGIEMARAQAAAAKAQIQTAQASIDAAISERDTAQLQIDMEIPSKIEQAKQQLDLTQTNYDNIKQMYESGIAAKKQYDEISTKLEVDKQTYRQAMDAKTVAESKLKAAQAQIEAAESTKAAAEESYNAAVAQISSAQSTTKAAQAQTDAAKSQQQAANNSLDDTVIYSPIDGVVLKKVMNSGETVAAGTPIAIVGSEEKMWVRVGVPDNYINKVREGQKAVIRVYGADSVIEGRVDKVGALADTATRTFTVNIAADNKNKELKSGMVCSAEIIFSGEERIFAPIDSVISLPEGDFVFVMADEATVKRISVVTGDIQGDKIEIKEGLSTGDRLVTEGQFVLNDGDGVSVER